MGRLNQPAKPGYSYRSPGQTNAADLTPNLREDVIASQRADAERIGKGLSTNESPAQTESRRNSPHGNISQKDAAGRAILRTAGRVGNLGAALGAGYDAGRILDEEFGAGKKLVEATGLGRAAEKIATPKDKVELSDYAKRRANEEEIDQLTRETKAEKEAERQKRKDQEEWNEGKAYKKGGSVRGWGIARGARKAKVY